MNKEKAADAFQQNKSTVLEFIYRHPQTSRIEIANSTGITPATITNIVTELLESKILIETGAEIQSTVGSGRKRKVLTLNPEIGQFLGVEFNLKGFSITATDLCGNVIATLKQPVDENSIHNINQVVTTLVKKIIKNVEPHNIIGLGIAIPGHFDRTNHTVISNSTMWQEFNLSKINNVFDFPIVIENNVECMALGEYLFHPISSPKKFIFLHVGHGLFCSFFNSSRLGFKTNHYLGEVGHTVVDIHGPKCECGKNGCLQTFISESWLLRNARYLYENSSHTVLHSLAESSSMITLKTIIDAYQLHDPYIQKNVELGINLLGTSIANTLIMQDADKIYLNSQLFTLPEFKTLVLTTIQNQLRFIPTERTVDIEVIEFKTNRGAIGACALAAISFFIKHPKYI